MLSRCLRLAVFSWLILRHTQSCSFSSPCFLCPILLMVHALCSSFEDICP